MADNIKIVGEIVNIQEISRYNEEDVKLFSTQILKEDFGQQNDYIEYFIYDAANNLLNTTYNYLDYKLPNTSNLNPSNGNLPIIEIDPVKDLQNSGYSSGEFIVQYNFFNNKISDSSAGLFIKEISSDRTELRISSTVLSNSEIENATLSIINEYDTSPYFVDYLANLGENNQVVIVNVALNKLESGYEILLKLYQPLSEAISEKTTLWIVKEKVSPYQFNVNLDKLILSNNIIGNKLRGPNFNIDNLYNDSNQNKNNLATSYQTYDNLYSLSNNSYQQFLSLITSQSIDINTDYSNFENFVFFGSAEQRVKNFYTKVSNIEDLKNNITVYTSLTASRPNLVYDLNTATASLNGIISNFDGFEYYLYFESGSVTTSTEYGITPYPKSNSVLPYTLFSTGSISASLWYNSATSSANYYDDYNQNNLVYTLPDFIKNDTNNDQYITFVNMIGHYFDNIWIYIQAITDINLANNNLEQGVSKDLVYFTLQSLGTKLYNNYGNSDNISFFVGNNSGSSTFDNNFTPTGSYLNNIPRKDLLAETYKRIYHNLPLLLKTKGTTYGLQTLISTFGITSSILNVKEYGGDLKSGILDEYNTDKVRIVSNTITGSVLSPYISLQSIPTASTLFRTNDLHYVDISFSPETQIDKYASASIVAANPTWSIDDYIGDPRQLYSGSYSDLDIQRKTYYNFTSSNMDYAGFIRLIQFFDNSLFKMLKDFVPARTNLSTGITISSPVLERNKWSVSNPSSTSKINVNEGTISGPTVETEYNNLYSYLTGSKLAYYDGNITGSNINVYQYYGEFNPYLHPTSSLTAGDLNVFNHTDFNVLLNNVSASRLSTIRKKVEPIYTTNDLRLAGYSSSYFAELQDSYESLRSHQLSRYEGVKVSGVSYNTYTTGDKSFGKSSVIDHNVRKIGLFTSADVNKFLPKRTNAVLKYLVDDQGNLTELNLRNNNWFEVQNTFVLGNTGSVSQFNPQLYTNQKTTDGPKLIFDSGYSYNPTLYFGAIESDTSLAFLSSQNEEAYKSTAVLSGSNFYISGSSTNRFPLSGGYVYNIFNNVTEGSTYFKPGSNTNFPSYSATTVDNYNVQISLPITYSVPDNTTHDSSWTLQVYKRSATGTETLITSDSATFSFTTTTTTTTTTTSTTTTTTTARIYDSYSFGYNGVNPYLACADTASSPVIRYMDYGTIPGIGEVLYNDSGLTTPATPGYYATGGLVYQVAIGSGIMETSMSCIPTTTTTTTTTTSTTTTTTTANPIFNTIKVGYDRTDPWNACQEYSNSVTISRYVEYGNILTTDIPVYYDNALTIPTPAGYYASGGYYYEVDDTGFVIGSAVCAAPTTTTTSTTTTTTTPSPFITVGVWFDAESSYAACLESASNSEPSLSRYIASSSQYLKKDIYLYYDSELTIPAFPGYYTSGGYSWTINDSGYVITSASCGVVPTTTTTSTTTTTTTNPIFRTVQVWFDTETAYNACFESHSGAPSIARYIEYAHPSLSADINLYYDNNLTIPAFPGYYASGGYSWQVSDGGYIVTSASCGVLPTTTTTSTSTTTTTQQLSIAVSVWFDAESGYNACFESYSFANGTSSYTSVTRYIESASLYLKPDIELYYDADLTIPAFDGFYASGSKSYEVSNGYVLNGIACGVVPTTTTTSTTTTTTTTAISKQVIVWFDRDNADFACYESSSSPQLSMSRYIAFSDDHLQQDIYLYYDNTLEIPAIDGYYASSGSVYYIAPGDGGYISSVSTCVIPTTTSTTTTTTTVATYKEEKLRFSAATSRVCTNPTQSFYIEPELSVALDTVIYRDDSLLITALAGYYVSGSGNASRLLTVNDDGIITNLEPWCEATTTTTTTTSTTTTTTTSTPTTTTTANYQQLPGASPNAFGYGIYLTCSPNLNINIYLNSTDRNTFNNNGYVLEVGMFIATDASGTSIGTVELYDPGSTTIFQVTSGYITSVIANC